MVSENGKKNRRNWTKIQAARKSKHLHVSEATTPAASVEPQHSAMASSMTFPKGAAPPTELRLGSWRNVWTGLQHRWIWAVAFNMQGLETTEQLPLLLSRGFTPRPLFCLKIGRMQLEAVCDGVFQRVVSHAWVTWCYLCLLLYVSFFMLVVLPAGWTRRAQSPRFTPGLYQPCLASKPGSSQPSAVSGETGNN